MPDIVTSLMIPVIYLLCFQLPALSRLEVIYFTLLACIAITAHISHLPQAFPLVSGARSACCLSNTVTIIIDTRGILSILSTTAILLNNIVIYYSPFFRIISSGTELSSC
jgi:hypothetical protein